MQIDESSLMVTINPVVLLAGLAVFCVIAYICARKYRNTNDFAKSVKLYIPVMLGMDAVFFILGIPVIVLLGIDLAGFVVMAQISNHYFYN